MVTVPGIPPEAHGIMFEEGGSMKIWRAFGSAHSARLTIVGKFEDVDTAELARRILEDFGTGEHEDAQAFNVSWKDALPILAQGFGLRDGDMETGQNDSYRIEREGETVTVSNFSGDNTSGLMRILLAAGSEDVRVSGQGIW